jgi:hypothetical protein
MCADGSVIYRKIMDSSDIDRLETDLTRLGEWAAENDMKINLGKKAVSLTKAMVKEKKRYNFADQFIPETRSLKNYE